MGIEVVMLSKTDKLNESYHNRCIQKFELIFGRKHVWKALCKDCSLAGRKHMENQNKIFKPRIEMPVISAIFFSGNENDQIDIFKNFEN
jgi:hypothetical protein